MKIYNSFIALFVYGVLSAQRIWSFNDCLNYAKENNLQVVASRLNEKVQEQEYKISKKEKLPDITGSIGNSVSYAPKTNLNASRAGLLGSRDNGYTGSYSNDMGVSSTILLYNYGRLKKNEEKSELLLQQNKYITERIQKDISLQLIGNYLTILLNKELSGVEKNLLQNNEEQLDRNQKMYNAGSIPKSTLYEAKSNLAGAKQRYETSIIEIDRSLMILAMLLQKDYEDFEIEDVVIPDDISLPLINIHQIIDYAYANQPDIKSSEIGIEAAKKDIELAKTSFYPTITGGYKIGTGYQDYFDKEFKTHKSLNDQWLDNHQHTFTLGMSIPIFNKGINKIKVEQAKLSQKIKENDLDQQKLTLKQAIQTSYFDVSSSYQTFLSAKEAVESANLSYDVAQKSFAAGKLNIYDLNTARNSYYNALSQMIQAKYSYIFRMKVLDYYAGNPLELSGKENSAPISSSIMNLDKEIQKEELKQENNIKTEETATQNPKSPVVPEEERVVAKVREEDTIVKQKSNLIEEPVKNNKVEEESIKPEKQKGDVKAEGVKESTKPNLQSQVKPKKKEEPAKTLEKDTTVKVHEEEIKVEKKKEPVKNNKTEKKIIKSEKQEESIQQPEIKPVNLQPVNEVTEEDLLRKEGLSEEEILRRKAIYELRQKRKENEKRMEEEVNNLFDNSTKRKR